MAIANVEEAKATARLIKSGQIAGPAREKAMAALREFDASQGAPKFGDAIPAGPGSPEAAAQQKAYDAIPATPIRDTLKGIGEAVAPVTDAVIGTIKGAPEAAATAASGVGSAAVGGIKGVLQGKNLDEAANISRQFMEENTYQPKTREGQEMAGLLGAPGEIINKGGEFVAEKTGSPALGALATTIGNAAAMAGGGPKAAVERPALTIKHVADETGHHSTLSPNGETLSAETNFGRLRATRDDTAPSAQGQGEATARIERVIKEAEARGLIPESDISLSPGEANIWRTKLAERGYKVKENPNEPSANGILSKDPKKGVFEIEPVTKTERGQMTPTELHADDVKFLLDENVPLTTEQRGTNMTRKVVGGAARGADAVLGESPTRALQDQTVASVALDTVGVDAKNASPEVMGALKRDIGGKMNALHEAVPTHTPAEFIEGLNNLAEEAKMHPNASAIIARIEHIKKQIKAGNAETGTPPLIPGKAAQSIRTGLDEAMGSTHSDIVQMAGKIKELLDDAFEKSAEAIGKPELAAKMDKERGRWHRMKQIEDAIKGSPTHTISPSKLLTALERKRNRNQSIYGNTPDPMDAKLNRLAHAAKNVLREPVANSGTVARGIGLGTLGILGEAVALGHPVAGAVSVGSLYGAAKAARMLNEANAMRGTKSQGQKAAPVKPSKNNLTAKAIRATVASNVSPEERKRRLQAEALRNQ